MGQYLLIDSETKTTGEIKACILSTDPNAIFVSHPTTAEWLKEKKDEKLQFDIIFLEYSEFSVAQWPAQLEIIAKEVAGFKPSTVIMIGHEDPLIVRKKLIALNIFNFVFKPFDPLILKETINGIGNYGKRQNSAELKSQKSSATVGILKEIELQSISELGFVTLSEEQIPTGATSKYFSNIFSNDKKQSIWAQCLRSIPYPQKPGVFINQFQYFGIESGTLLAVRRFIQDHKLDSTSAVLWNQGPPKSIKPIRAALIGTDEANIKKFQSDLITRFSNLNCDIIATDKLEQNLNFDLVFNWTDLGAAATKKVFGDRPLYFLIRDNPLTDEARKEVVENYRDLFLAPLDRGYLYRKLKTHCPDLCDTIDSPFLNITCHEKMRSANLIQISDISEVYFTFMYNRELPLRTTREITLIAEDERNLLALQAFCVFTEKSQNEKGKFIHQFAFFGMTDHFLKAIRVWLLQDYVQQKQKNQ